MALRIEYHDDLDFRTDRDITFPIRSTIPEPIKEFAYALLQAARSEWNDEVWEIFDLYAEHRILTVRKWFLSFTFRVKHCGALVALLVGPRPQE